MVRAVVASPSRPPWNAGTTRWSSSTSSGDGALTPASTGSTAYERTPRRRARQQRPQWRPEVHDRPEQQLVGGDVDGAERTDHSADPAHHRPGGDAPSFVALWRIEDPARLGERAEEHDGVDGRARRRREEHLRDQRAFALGDDADGLTGRVVQCLDLSPHLAGQLGHAAVRVVTLVGERATIARRARGTRIDGSGGDHGPIGTSHHPNAS